jgi:Pyruvate/2-oxoacid:ferredoxin oxidoreductase delta subunit
MLQRKIVAIDEAKCDGCGQCVPSCAEGAIRIVDGKARLVADIYCDGLGACLGTCPRDAISIVERDAEPFDETAVHAHVADSRRHTEPAVPIAGCPGTAMRDLRLDVLSSAAGGCPSLNGKAEGARTATPSLQHATASRLANWPIQLQLVPPNAPFLQRADVLLVADCVPVALPDFHPRHLNGNPLLLACPKLDNAAAYVQKLAQMFRASRPQSITVLHMEVPCCVGLVRIVETALAMSGLDIPMREVTVSIAGAEVASNSASPVQAK